MVKKLLLFTCDICGAERIVNPENGEIFPSDFRHYPAGVMGTKHRCGNCLPQPNEKKGGER
jgi:hypothetical protein